MVGLHSTLSVCLAPIFWGVDFHSYKYMLSLGICFVCPLLIGSPLVTVNLYVVSFKLHN